MFLCSAWKYPHPSEKTRGRKRMLRAVAVSGHSMYPVLQEGDVALVRTKAHNPQPGDIIVYRESTRGFLVVHRIERVTAAGCITRGDANAAPDPQPVARGQIIGKVCFVISCLRWLVKHCRKRGGK